MKKFKILIVDDEADITRSMVEILKYSKDYIFYQALNGNMAYKIILEKLPDLIITDWVMPEMNGIELIKRIKNNDKTAHIPIMMATGAMMTFQDLDIALNAGALDYVRKPIDKIELRARVKSMLMLSESIKTIKRTNIELREQTEELNQLTELLKVSNKSLEKKVKKRTKKLKKALNESKKAEKLIASFLSNMSHEIRTPMNAISGFSQLITQAEVTDEQREEYNIIINQSVDSLLEQIDNIMHVSKMHSGTCTLKNTAFSLKELFGEILESFDNKTELQKTDVSLNWEQKATGNINIFADKQVFKQIIHQLVSNALKYTEKGKVVFGYDIQLAEQGHAQTTVFKIADKNAQKTRTKLIIYVKDTGLGIDKKQQQYIFDAFKKIEGKEKLFRGSGLGLAIVKNLCDSVNAKIKLESELNKGSVFTVKFALTDK